MTRRLSCALLATGLAAGATAQTGVPLSRVALVERQVELGSERDGWRAASEGASLRTGESLRTGDDGLARVELLWTALTVSPGSALSLPDDFILSIALSRGRVRIESGEREMLQLVTAEAEVRGRGEAVVRRSDGSTLVSALAGRLLVDAAGRSVALRPGEGTVVRAGRAPTQPAALPGAPHDVWPSDDCAYVAPGELIELAAQGSAAAHHLEILAEGSERVLIDRDVGPGPWRMAIPWPGAFRWRVAARDARGLEGAPSEEGVICVDG